MTTAARLSPTVVCVLGVSRSGTSLTARVLNLLGVYLGGEEALIEANRFNAEGYWENRRITQLNARIVKSLGGTGRAPPDMPPGWESDDSLTEERDEARAIVDEVFAGRSLWGWKDPLNCLTLPFWQQLLPDMRYVVCIRNPVDTVASGKKALARLKPIGDDEAYRVWRRHLASALAHTSGRPRLFVRYEDYFDDWRRVAYALARFVGADPLRMGEEPMWAVEAAINAGLRHHRSPTEEMVSEESVPSDVASLHLITRLLCATGGESADGRSAGPKLADAADLYARRLLATSGG